MIFHDIHLLLEYGRIEPYHIVPMVGTILVFLALFVSQLLLCLIAKERIYCIFPLFGFGILFALSYVSLLIVHTTVGFYGLYLLTSILFLLSAIPLAWCVYGIVHVIRKLLSSIKSKA